MKVLSPQARRVTTQVSAVARPKTLDSLRIGLLDNTKAPVDRIMAHLAQRLAGRAAGVSTRYVSKLKTSIPAGPAIMADLRRDCDVLITALGD